MGKILTVVLGLAAVLYVAHYVVTGGAGGGGGGGGEQNPQQRLKNVRQAAQRIEDESQQRVEDALKRAETAEQQ